MKNVLKSFTLLVLFLVSGLTAFSQAIHSGSLQIDADLNQINVSANADFGAFKAELGVNYGISERRIEYFHSDLHMEPAEIYLALEMSRVSGREVDQVIEVHRKNNGKGWGSVAKELGIKPGSPEFHQLKNSVKKKCKDKGEARHGNGKGNGKGKDHGNGNGHGRGHGKGHE